MEEGICFTLKGHVHDLMSSTPKGAMKQDRGGQIFEAKPHLVGFLEIKLKLSRRAEDYILCMGLAYQGC